MPTNPSLVIENNVETIRIEPELKDGKVHIQGGVVTFDWKTGHTRAVWDDGQEENWHLHGIKLQAKADAYFNLTNQEDRVGQSGPPEFVSRYLATMNMNHYTPAVNHGLVEINDAGWVKINNELTPVEDLGGYIIQTIPFPDNQDQLDQMFFDRIND